MKKKTVAEKLDDFFSDDSNDDIVLYDLPKDNELLEYNNEPTILEEVGGDYEVIPDKKND